MEVAHNIALDFTNDEVTQEIKRANTTDAVNATALTIAIEDLHRSAHNFCSTGGIYALRSFDAAVERVSRWVALDDLGGPAACGDELLFRAVRLVCSVQNRRLRLEYEALACRPFLAFHPDWETPAWWSGFVEATRLMDVEIEKATAAWRRYRGNRIVQRAQSNYVSYAKSILEQLCRLERIAAIERMLYRGVASQSTSISSASQSIIAVLKVKVGFYAVDSKRRLLRGQ